MKYTADFETTTDLKDCRVWAWAICTIDDKFRIEDGISIESFIERWKNSKGDSVYFHNLKFDGESILYHLLKNGWKVAIDEKHLVDNSILTLISDMGLFYTMELIFKVDNKGKKSRFIKIYDSLKILPFSVEKVAKSFNLEISKLSIDYSEYREVGHELTDKEREYVHTDVLIMAKALKQVFDGGLVQMTQGSNALHDYKEITGKNFKKLFPVLDYELDKDIRKSYKGGFCYANPKFAGKEIGEGIVLDVNSLYPSVMRYKLLPYGEPIGFEGKYQYDKWYPLYTQWLYCEFKLKAGYIPTIQLKSYGDRFKPNDYLVDNGFEPVWLCLTSVDLELFFEHYEVNVIEWRGGWKFKAAYGLFDEYVDKWVEVKNKATIDGNEGQRTLAKLMLNSLYGKFALNPDVRSKIPYLDYEKDKVAYRLGEPEQREGIYIPMGSFITSWARWTTITAAQKVFDRFLYADTDSLHLIGLDEPEGLEIDPVKLGAWKHESTFSRGKYLRQKCYIEEINGKLKITCAGMPSRCYDGIELSENGEFFTINNKDILIKKNDALPKNVFNGVTWDNFEFGNTFLGKLRPTHTGGGIVLVNTVYTLKK